MNFFFSERVTKQREKFTTAYYLFTHSEPEIEAEEDNHNNNNGQVIVT